MTDTIGDHAPLFSTEPDTVVAQSGSPVWRTSSWQPALLIVVVATAAVAWLISGSARPSPLDGDAELAALLRFMAAVKATIALAVLGVTAWRLGHPAPAPVALLYVAAVTLMAAAPGVIWQLAHVGVGAAFFMPGCCCFSARWSPIAVRPRSLPGGRCNAPATSDRAGRSRHARLREQILPAVDRGGDAGLRLGADAVLQRAIVGLGNRDPVHAVASSIVRRDE